jgi:four helix bundle protein
VTACDVLLSKEFAHFLLHSRGSLSEFQTQILIAKELQYISEGECCALAQDVRRPMCDVYSRERATCF